MKKNKVITILACTVCFILLIVSVFILYDYGIIYSQNTTELYNSINVNVMLNSHNNTPLYGRGFFIDENKVVMQARDDFDNFEMKIMDRYGNMYNVIDKKVYEKICIAKIDGRNIHEAKYLYGHVKNNDIIEACITKDNIVKDYKVIDNHYGTEDNILCDGIIEWKAGGTAIDKHGRIIGMTMNNGTGHPVFFIIPIYDILEKAKDLD